MAENIPTIKAIEPTQDILDFKYLKELGLAELQKLTGNIWTDYNHHDPGITVLEILAYALTELGFRSQYPVEDILSNKEQMQNTLYRTEEILPSNAVTIKDYHKIILDIEGVKDAIIYPSRKFPEFKGLFAINIELYPEFDTEIKQTKIVNTIFEKLHKNRNLCETFYKISFIEHVPVIFDIDIEVNAQQNLADVYLEMYRRLTEYLAPTINFYGIDELLEQGFETDQIFTGPLLENGFVLESEFKRIDLRNKIFASDLIHFIMEIPGVVMIKKLQIRNENNEYLSWFYSVEQGKAFKINLEESSLRFFKVGKEVKLEQDMTQELKNIDLKGDSKLLYKRLTFEPVTGTNRSLSSYYSIQNDFPDVYGIGELGLLSSETLKRKGQTKQFKGYLMFFEQILANFFAQLENLASLFSIEEIANTYNSQPLNGVPGAEFVYREFVAQCMKKNMDVSDQKLMRREWKNQLDKFSVKLNAQLHDIVEDRATFYDRRNRILDHLLARMAFKYSDYRFDFDSEGLLQEALIKHKTIIATEFIQLSKGRAAAQSMLPEDLLIPDNISGLEYRIKTLLKLEGTSTEFPFDYFKNGLFLGDINSWEENLNDLSFSFANLFGDVAMDALFLYGSAKQNYQILENESKYSIQLFNSEGTLIADVLKEFLEKDAAAKLVDDICNRLIAISKLSESIQVIERILYRPHLEMKYFTFSIWLNKETIAFINDGYLTFNERNLKVQTILLSATNPNNYSFIELGNQYKILLKNNDGEVLLTSHRFFNSLPEVAKEIEELVDVFVRIEKGTLERDTHFRFYTKHYDTFNLVDNPYSFITTILIPSWPVKFQNQAYKTLLENKIREETPAHIYPDIKWVGINNMVNIVELTREYNQLLIQTPIDFEKLEQISEDLFRYFVRL